MEPENYTQEAPQVEQSSSLHQVTPLSKYLAMSLFVILPFAGGYVGYTIAPEKIVEVEKIVEIERILPGDVDADGMNQSADSQREVNNTSNTGESNEKYIFTTPDEYSEGIRRFSNVLYEFDGASKEYELVAEFLLDVSTEDLPHSPVFVDKSGSSLYFSEGFHQQQLYVIDVDAPQPVLTELPYRHLRAGNYGVGPDWPGGMILVTTQTEPNKLWAFNIDTKKVELLYTQTDNFSFVEPALGYSTYLEEVSDDGFTLSLVNTEDFQDTRSQFIPYKW